MLLLKILHLFKDLWAVRCYFNFELVLLSSECEVKLLILYLSLYSFHSEKKKVYGWETHFIVWFFGWFSFSVICSCSSVALNQNKAIFLPQKKCCWHCIMQKWFRVDACSVHVQFHPILFLNGYLRIPLVHNPIPKIPGVYPYHIAQLTVRNRLKWLSTD